MSDVRRCTQCGKVIPWGEVECPVCSPHGGFLWSLERDTFLLLIFLVLLVMFVVAGFVVKFYHGKEKVLAQRWYNRGETELAAGRPETAVEDFRTALAYSRDVTLYRLRLAQALVMANRFDEARSYLLSLWESEPGNGTVNLELGRLAARERSVEDAQRYYHNAMYGEWDKDPVRRRREVRFELAEFLLQTGQMAQAQGELIALAADLPPDPEMHVHVGNLLLRVSDYGGALTVFKKALTLRPRLAAALAGAGEACFELNNFLQAQRYLSRALAEDPQATRAASMLETARMVLAFDPAQRGIGNQEAARRTLRAFAKAMTRLQDCAEQRGMVLDAAGGGELQATYAEAAKIKPRMRERALSRDPELIMTAMDTVFEIEKMSARQCGEPYGADRALLLLANAQGGNRP